jgi:peptidoglycan/LPS O-acetylase OafA/YrhL
MALEPHPTAHRPALPGPAFHLGPRHRRPLAVPTAPATVAGGGRYMPGLDGLRALAVAAVVAFHLNLGWAQGGLVGVGVFFVLSGYLITDLIAAEWERLGHIDLGAFWLRRARRLLPALAAMLVAVVAWLAVTDPARLAGLRGDVLAAALYASNWWLIFHHVSYFARFGPPSPLGHLWSLAVEEQFYLFWPPVVAICLAWFGRRGPLAVVAVAGAAASALLMAGLYVPGTDPSRVYYGTDTRAFALLAGAALAAVWPSARLVADGPAQRLSPRLLDVGGGIGLAAIVALVALTNEYQPFLYPTGLLILSAASVLAVAALAHPGTRLGRVFGWSPLRWLGVRSYGIYLWHYPVIALTTPLLDVAAPAPPVRAVVQVGASVALAALSWRFVEQPVRHGALARLGGRLLGRDRAATTAGRLRAWLVALAVVVAVAVAGAGLAFAPAAARPASGALGVRAVRSPLPARAARTTPGASRAHPPASSPQRPPAVAPAAAPPPTVGGDGGGGGPTPRPRPPLARGADAHAQDTSWSLAACHGVSAIGDSVILDAKPYLKALVPGIRVDGRVGRQLYQAVAVVRSLRARGELGGCVVIELGTNGPFTQGQLIGLLRALGPVRRVVLVNTRVPRPWQNAVNAMLAQAAREWPRVVLVDWYAASANRPADFWPDGVHLDPVGARYYATLVVRALKARL